MNLIRHLPLASYFLFMGVSSILGFAKIIVLASFFDVESFGDYISIYGVIIFVSTFVSFGKIEETIKLYPKFFEMNEPAKVAGSSVSVIKVLLVRYFYFLIVLFSCFFVFDLKYNFVVLVVASIASCCISILLVYASIVRAAYKIELQNKFYFVRALLIFCFSIALGFWGGWQAALFGELLASMLTIFYVSRLCKSLGADPFSFWSVADAEYMASSKKDKSGLKLYLSFTLSSITLQLDKMFVNQFAGVAQAGIYGVANIFPQAAGVLVNIVSQRVGAKLIRLSVDQRTIFEQVKLVLICLFSFFFFVIIAAFVVFLLKNISYVEAFYSEYSVNSLIIIVSTFMAVMKIYALLEFFLIAHHLETQVLLTNIFCSSLVLVGFFLCYMNEKDVVWYLFSVLFARLFQVIWQLILISKTFFRLRGGSENSS